MKPTKRKLRIKKPAAKKISKLPIAGLKRALSELELVMREAGLVVL
jgi:hypothetical protein